MSYQIRRAGLYPAAALLIWAAVMAAPAWASSLIVDPVRVEITADKKIASVRVSNKAETPVTIRVYVLTWDQRNGENVYGETTGVIASPPITTIAPGKTQIIRIGLRQASSAGKAYRVMIEEVPEANPGNGIQVSLRLDLPLFAMQQAGTPAQLTWAVSQQPGGRWMLEATNKHASYVRIEPAGITAATGLASDGLRFGVVLPNSHLRWVLGSKPQVKDRTKFQRVGGSWDDRTALTLRRP